VTVTAPGMSKSLCPSPFRLSGTIRTTSGSTSSTTGTLTRKTQRQLRYSVRMPPSRTPTAPPAPATAPQTPSALLRSLPSAKIEVTIARAAGESSAAPSPWAAREAISIASFCASPAVSEAAANNTRPAMKTFRRPSRSASLPPSNRKPPKVRTYELTTQERSDCAKPSADPIDGRATLVIEASSTTRNWAAASRIRIFIRSRPMPVCSASSAGGSSEDESVNLLSGAKGAGRCGERRRNCAGDQNPILSVPAGADGLPILETPAVSAVAARIGRRAWSGPPTSRNH
jgi:hypothetical protein